MRKLHLSIMKMIGDNILEMTDSKQEKNSWIKTSVSTASHDLLDEAFKLSIILCNRC